MSSRQISSWDCFCKYQREGYNLIAGLDEVGRGALSGPVVVAIVVFNKVLDELVGIEDSKSLTAKQRQQKSILIKDQCKYFAFGRAEANEIDKINILNATKLAAKRCIESLIIQPDFVLCDGNQKLVFDIPSIEIVKGDARCLPISASSILAKVYRDELMEKMSEKYPEYKWEKNKGYGSQEHIKAIIKRGVTKEHRLSFLDKVIKKGNLFEKL